MFLYKSHHSWCVKPNLTNCKLNLVYVTHKKVWKYWLGVTIKYKVKSVNWPEHLDSNWHSIQGELGELDRNNLERVFDYLGCEHLQKKQNFIVNFFLTHPILENGKGLICGNICATNNKQMVLIMYWIWYLSLWCEKIV